MRNILIFAAILVGLGVYMARVAETMATSKVVATSSRASVASAASSADLSRAISIDRDRSGHFRTEARVDGTYLDFLVDTGATVIALKERDAARLGLFPSPSEFTANVSTANGQAKAARARLASIEIGSVRVRDVDALIMPDGVLDQNLLGMAFLSRLKRFEYTGGKLVLEE